MRSRYDPAMSALHRRRLLIASASPLLMPMAADAQPAPLQLVSGHLPPFAIETEDARRGALVELVEAVMARAGWRQRVEFYPWARAMLMAGSQPRTLILPLTRTPEREAQFQWLLRLDVQHFAFLTRPDQALVRDFEQARRLRLVVLRGSPNRAQLLRHGVAEAQIREAATVEDMHRMLELDMVDAVFGGTVINSRQARDSGRPADWLRAGMVLESGDMWLAAGSGVSEAEQRLLLAAQQGLQADGTLAQLLRQYER